MFAALLQLALPQVSGNEAKACELGQAANGPRASVQVLWQVLTDAEWRFGESESYLRSLTSRDEKAFNVLVHMFFQTLARPGHCKMSRGELGALDETSWLESR